MNSTQTTRTVKYMTMMMMIKKMMPIFFYHFYSSCCLDAYQHNYLYLYLNQCYYYVLPFSLLHRFLSAANQNSAQQEVSVLAATHTTDAGVGQSLTRMRPICGLSPGSELVWHLRVAYKTHSCTHVMVCNYLVRFSTPVHQANGSQTGDVT